MPTIVKMTIKLGLILLLCMCFILFGCSEKKIINCNPTEICKNFNDCSKCSSVQMGCIKIEDVNPLINLTNGLIAYYNQNENASVQYLPFYKEVGE